MKCTRLRICFIIPACLACACPGHASSNSGNSGNSGINGSSSSASTSNSPSYPLDSALPGIPSPYTPLIQEMTKNWLSQPQADPTGPSSSAVKLECYSSPHGEFYIGIGQAMRIDAPFKAVQAVLDDFDHYAALFPGFKNIHVTERDGNRATLSWEQTVPFFLAPNVKYELSYLSGDLKTGTRVYRYQLKSSQDLKTDDGMIVIESQDEGHTLYHEYDFWDAHWGLATTLAPGRIWGDSLEGIFISDLAIKYKSEHPEWSYDKIKNTAKNQLKGLPKDSLIREKKIFQRSHPVPPPTHEPKHSSP